MCDLGCAIWDVGSVMRNVRCAKRLVHKLVSYGFYEESILLRPFDILRATEDRWSRERRPWSRIPPQPL